MAKIKLLQVTTQDKQLYIHLQTLYSAVRYRNSFYLNLGEFTAEMSHYEYLHPAIKRNVIICSIHN